MRANWSMVCGQTCEWGSCQSNQPHCPDITLAGPSPSAANCSQLCLDRKGACLAWTWGPPQPKYNASLGQVPGFSGDPTGQPSCWLRTDGCDTYPDIDYCPLRPQPAAGYTMGYKSYSGNRLSATLGVGAHLERLRIVIRNESDVLDGDTSYSYNLTDSADGTEMVLSADTAYGAVSGLETFSQLFLPDGSLPFADVAIVDRPQYKFRGVGVDIASRFYEPALMRTILDTMAWSKFNNLYRPTFLLSCRHCHLSDQQLFTGTCTLQTLPTGCSRMRSPSSTKHLRRMTLMATGCPLSPNLHRCHLQQRSIQLNRSRSLTCGCRYYTKQELADLIFYARQRGIRVVPMLEFPAHAGWAEPLMTATGIQSCLKDDKSGLFGAEIHNDKEGRSLAVLLKLVDELMTMFPDEKMFHLGGEEMNYYAPGGCTINTTIQLQIKVRAHLLAHGRQPLQWYDARTTGGLWTPPEVKKQLKSGMMFPYVPNGDADDWDQANLTAAGYDTVVDAAEWCAARALTETVVWI
eukprot:COSAG04_NODE_122_length_24803_cov_180.609415_3_plen_520_part_00